MSFNVTDLYTYIVLKATRIIAVKLRRPKTGGSMKTKSIVVQLGHQLPENVLKLRCVRIFVTVSPTVAAGLGS